MEFSNTLERNGQKMVSPKPHFQDRATNLSLSSIFSATNQNPSTQGIPSNYSACYTYMMEHLYLKSYETLKKAYTLSSSTLPKFGLEMHIVWWPKPSKTECIFFPPPGFFNDSSHSSPVVDIDFSQVTIHLKKDNKKQNRHFFMVNQRSTMCRLS